MTSGIRWLSRPPGSGYGDASEAYIAGLRTAGVPVSWTPLGWPSAVWGAPFGPARVPEIDGATHEDIVDLAIEHDTVVVSSTPLWHERLAAEGTGRRLVAFTAWETDRLPAEWVEILNRYDSVLVPSHFNATVVTASGVAPPVHVVPHIARAPLPVHAPRASDGAFTFYVIATWTTRKAILDVVRAYVDAFTAADQVRLLIHTTPQDLIAGGRIVRSGQAPAPHECASHITLARALAGRRNVPKISLSTRTLTRGEVAALHAAGDCYVSLSRAEGWGLCAFDAAVCGNPAIVTGWGGTLEFLPDDYPYCVGYDLVPTSDEEADYWWEPRAGERWARARIAHASELLRHVFEHREEARSWGRLLQSTITTTFSEARVTPRLLAALA